LKKRHKNKLFLDCLLKSEFNYFCFAQNQIFDEKKGEYQVLEQKEVEVLSFEQQKVADQNLIENLSVDKNNLRLFFCCKPVHKLYQKPGFDQHESNG